MEERNIQIVLKLFVSDDHKLNSCIIVYVHLLVQVSPIRMSDSLGRQISSKYLWHCHLRKNEGYFVLAGLDFWG